VDKSLKHIHDSIFLPFESHSVETEKKKKILGAIFSLGNRPASAALLDFTRHKPVLLFSAGAASGQCEQRSMAFLIIAPEGEKLGALFFPQKKGKRAFSTLVLFVRHLTFRKNKAQVCWSMGPSYFRLQTSPRSIPRFKELHHLLSSPRLFSPRLLTY
jgi:hypothetical protein